MAIKSQPSNAGSYEDFQPSSNWIREDSVDTIVIHLPGFKKENLRVQIDSHGNLKISGERPLEDDNRFYRFRKEFRVPPNCNRNEITAKFYAGLLYVKLPKKIAEISAEAAQAKPIQEAQGGYNTGNERKFEQEMDSGYQSFMGGIAAKLSNHRKLVVGVVVILSIAIGLGIYGAVKLRSPGGGGDGEEVFYNVNH